MILYYIILYYIITLSYETVTLTYVKMVHKLGIFTCKAKTSDDFECLHFNE